MCLDVLIMKKQLSLKQHERDDFLLLKKLKQLDGELALINYKL
jgi:hypothetical protein